MAKRALMRGKKIWGRKRHTCVDTEGNLMEVKVTGASASDLAGGKKLLSPLTLLFPRLKHIWGESHYGGKLIAWIKEQPGWNVEIVRGLGNAKGSSKNNGCNVRRPQRHWKA